MEKHKKHDLEEDKYKREEGREAFRKEDETNFLDKEALDADLTDIPDENGDHGRIVSFEHPENEEWHAREKQNEGKAKHP